MEFCPAFNNYSVSSRRFLGKLPVPPARHNANPTTQSTKQGSQVFCMTRLRIKPATSRTQGGINNSRRGLCQLYTGHMLVTIFKHFPRYRCFFDTFAADDFWKHFGKWRNCSLWAISHFATMFSTLFNNCSFVYREFPYFWLNVFKVVCCICAVHRKGLTYKIIIH